MCGEKQNKITTDDYRAVGIGLELRDALVSEGVERDVAEMFSNVAQQSAMKMAEWKNEQFKLFLVSVTVQSNPVIIGDMLNKKIEELCKK